MAATARSVAGASARMSAQDLDLVNEISQFFDDPLGWVMYAFPWGERGTRLQDFDGPDVWQVEVLDELGMAIRSGLDIKDALPIMLAVASGHGIGKTALIAWIILWFISTREHPEIIVTAGKQDQLTGKTWRELAKWNKLSICSHWFHWTATKLQHVLAADTWFAHAIPWSKNSPENFAGTHEQHVLVIFDEASAIDDVIWETTDGAMTTPGAMWIAFGNPTKATGRFAQCFGKFKALWRQHQIDSRTCKMANRRLLDLWVETYGEDHDFVRVRVRGMFPRSGDLQFITIEELAAAYKRILEPEAYRDAAKIMAVDIARHGSDQSVIARRWGRKMFKLKRMRITDLMKLASVIAAEIDDWGPEFVFIDATGMGWGVYDRLIQLGYKQCIAVQVGEHADNEDRYKNLRAEIWDRARINIRAGMDMSDLKDDKELESEFTEPLYGVDDRGRFELESKDDMKERGLSSPDGADAIALCFTAPVAARPRKKKTWRDKLRSRGRGPSAMSA
jgi:hypothetical protein